MQLKLAFILTWLSISILSPAQKKLISGPWAGNVELRSSMIWLEVSTEVKKVAVRYFPISDSGKQKTVTYSGILGQTYNPIKITLNDLEFGTTYGYKLILDGREEKLPFATQFSTKDLWQYRKPAPDFSFLAGSCAYFNESKYDRPGKPYGGDSSIFETMAKTTANFHVWLGDNWYAREVDYSTAWGLNYRASHDRAQPILQAFMAAMPHYAIWDDHDYGPNDAGKSYHLKEESRKIFQNYWLNPSYGEKDDGIYNIVSYGDVDLFLTDDRYFRADDKMSDSIHGSLNENKTFFGNMQMEWLKNALLFSRATFKIIVTGSQVLNPANKYESLQDYPFEYKELMDFLQQQKINGVLFLTGDRHHSEIIKLNRENSYPLYDITVSPYTSGVSKVSGAELNNPFRESNTLVEAQNFAKISINGEKGKRIFSVSFIGIRGEQLGKWSVMEEDIKHK